MELIEKLIAHYKLNPPRLSYDGREGRDVKGAAYPSWPKEEEIKLLGVGSIAVWRGRIPGTKIELPVEGYCVVDACLDETGRFIPEALPLWPEMEGHELSIIVYVDRLDCVRMRAIGGFTTIKTRAEIANSETN